MWPTGIGVHHLLKNFLLVDIEHECGGTIRKIRDQSKLLDLIYNFIFDLDNLLWRATRKWSQDSVETVTIQAHCFVYNFQNASKHSLQAPALFSCQLSNQNWQWYVTICDKSAIWRSNLHRPFLEIVFRNFLESLWTWQLSILKVILQKTIRQPLQLKWSNLPKSNPQTMVIQWYSMLCCYSF